jgi:tRNA 5-methylaminomethyl-2-thiouridine biosynthesis bifunctional protein
MTAAMSTAPDHDAHAQLDWQDGAPRSIRFDDTYFSKEGGLTETRAVFLDGCGLPQSWAGRHAFTLGELGFGTGLNILALAELWARTRPLPNATLHVFSIEGFPMSRDEAARALGVWPELGDLAGPLLDQWPDGRRGWRRIEWPDIGVVLDLAIADVCEALQVWNGRADAWFLDGFAPARNPQMWTDEVLNLIAARSAPGARAASFTVAGAVRRGLAAAGFTVERVPGFGRKKQRLEAKFPGVSGQEPPLQRIAIVGAGIAGASLARAFRRLGVAPVVVEAQGAGAGASGNPAALVTPRLDAGLGPVAALHAQAFTRAVDLYRGEAPGAVIAEGALQLETGPRDTARFAAIAAWNGFAAEPRTPEGTGMALQEDGTKGSLSLPDALTIYPAAILTAWLGDSASVVGQVVALERSAHAWRLLDAQGRVLVAADIVCIASGAASAWLLPDAPLRPVRGQVSVSDLAFTGAPAAWGGYAVPTRDGGTLFGATHGRDDTGTDSRPQDDARNLLALAEGRPGLATSARTAPLTSRAAVRATTRDHLPMAGAVSGMEGVFVLSGLGGRGFTLAPLLAEAVAAEALGRAGPLPTPLKTLVAPGRFASKPV